jgi:outer membrane autotransporter protein
MRTSRAALAILLLSALMLLPTSTGSAQELIPLGTLPGLTPSQSSVGTAIDIICPKLSGNLTSAQQDLATRCADMKTGKLGLSVLPSVLGKVSPDEATAQGTNAIETRTPQLQPIGARLFALRLGATGISLSGLGPGFDAKTISARELAGLGEQGGGASADPLGRFGGFVNGIGSFGSKDATDREAGYRFHTAGVTAGADYRFLENLVGGAAFSYLRTNADISFGLGDVDSRSYGIALYGTYYLGPVYIDLLGGFTWYTYDTTRRIVYAPGPDAPPGNQGAAVDRTATGDTDGREYTFNGGVGYDFRLGASTLTPYFRVEYLHLDIDGYTERGAGGLDLRVKNQTAESLLTILGGRVAHAFSTPFGVLVPHLRGEWRHESLNGQRSIRAQFANDPFNVVFTVPTDSPDRDYFALGAGVAGTFRRGVGAFLDFETVLGLRGVTSHTFTAGVRIDF